MVPRGERPTNKTAVLAEMLATDGAQLFADALFDTVRVYDPKVWLAINPHLSERHRIT
jgi:hypothetical protein